MLFCPFSDSAMQNLDQGGNNGWVKIVFLLVLLLLSVLKLFPTLHDS